MILSVMITTYNCEDSIGIAIESVIRQEKPITWELLIGDDGSSDNTRSIIDDWIAKYPENIKLFIMARTTNSSKNGTRAARNRANLLENATGEYLAFLDGDDELLGTEKFVKQIQLLDLDVNRKCAGCAHNILVNNLVEKREYPLLGMELTEGWINTSKYWQSMYFHTNTILFRSSCKEMMLNERYRDFLNDNFITYIVLQFGELYYFRDIFARYNITGDGLWTGKKRTFGCFRNLIIYDLEVRINPGLKSESFKRHLYDFLYIFQNYSLEDKYEVKDLLNGLSRKEFPNTFLMSMTEPVMVKDKLIRVLLFYKCYVYKFYNHLTRTNIYFNRLINKYLRRN